MNPKKFKTLLVILTCLLVVSSISWAQNFDAMKNQVKEHTLKNGMKFIVLERHDAPVVSFHVYADVGSANENYGITGISHLLEHMAFKGSKVVGTNDYEAEAVIFDQIDKLYANIKNEKGKAEPDTAKLSELEAKFEELRKQAKEKVINNEYFDMMMQQGDAGVNAYTSNDATQYINSLPSNKLEFWMSMTSDRFMNPVIREFYKEKDVVMEERRLRSETQPIGKLFEDFMATSFKAHPYHHSVVGHMSDLERITRQDVRDYFKKYYQPSNLTAAIVGDVKAKKVFKMAELYFGRIPSGAKPEPVRTIEPEQWGERHVAVVAKSQPILLLGYHRPAETHEDDAALEALANIIGQGRSSRLWELLVKNEKVAIQAGSMNGWPGSKFPNLIAFYGVSAKDHTSAECLELIDTQIEKIKSGDISEEELTKFKRSQKKGIINGMKSNSRMAGILTHYDVIHGDWRKTFDQLKGIEGITAEDIKRVANKYLKKKNRTVGEIIPEEEAD
ncbi:insulinase family protein [candidate division KSB1 bacterium]|nr:insulinase family protein [candidate division KSB1 bacterium]MBL7094063.1 insulinase family protein [candidate division KSB1 bacterium]